MTDRRRATRASSLVIISILSIVIFILDINSNIISQFVVSTLTATQILDNILISYYD